MASECICPSYYCSGAIARARGEPLPLTPRFGGRSMRPEHKKRRGWRCWRSPSCADPTAKRPKTAMRLPHSSISFPKRSIQPLSVERKPCSPRRTPAEGPGGGPHLGVGRPPEGLTGVEGIAGNDLGP